MLTIAITLTIGFGLGFWHGLKIGWERGARYGASYGARRGVVMYHAAAEAKNAALREAAQFAQERREQGRLSSSFHTHS